MKPLALVVALAFPALVHAQSYPSKPVRLMIPFPPGGIDLPARIISVKMSENMGQQVVMDYRSGANGAIGCEVVARAAPDGYTLLYTTSNTHVVALFTTKNLPYDPVRDFTPISIANEGGMHLAVHPSNPASSLAELIEDARRNPGKISFASTGVGSFFQLIGEELKQLTGVDMLHVPYKGTGPMAQAVVAGEVTMYFGSGSVFPLVKAGKLKLLAYMDGKRSPFVPELPAATESLRAGGHARAARGTHPRRGREGAWQRGCAREAGGPRLHRHRQQPGGGRRSHEKRHRADRPDREGFRNPA
jgi:tripartite-type tricarboxylate transporter receptor subunit TctC